MLKVLIYGYATGTFSSRGIAKKLEEDVAYRYLSGGNFPAHRTISDFRCDHLSQFRSVFVQVVRLAQEVGLVKLGTLILDGTKVKANASKHKAMSYERMKKTEKQLRREIRAITALAKQEDAAEDVEFGPDFRGDELPEELARRDSRLKKIQAAKARLEARQKEEDQQAGRRPGDDKESKRGPKFKRRFGVPPDKKQDNFTDPESRIMKDSSGYQQCFNAQAAVDEKSQLIVATGLTNNAADVGQLEPMLKTAQANTGEKPKRALAKADPVFLDTKLGKVILFKETRSMKQVRRKRSERKKGVGETEGARRAAGVSPTGGAVVGALGPGQRWSVVRKREVALRLLRGESLEALSRELSVEMHRLQRWRDQAMAGIDESLRERNGDPLKVELDAAVKRVGELSMENELLRKKIGAARPLAFGRSRR